MNRIARRRYVAEKLGERLFQVLAEAPYGNEVEATITEMVYERITPEVQLVTDSLRDKLPGERWGREVSSAIRRRSI